MNAAAVVIGLVPLAVVLACLGLCVWQRRIDRRPQAAWIEPWNARARQLQAVEHAAYLAGLAAADPLLPTAAAAVTPAPTDPGSESLPATTHGEDHLS